MNGVNEGTGGGPITQPSGSPERFTFNLALLFDPKADGDAQEVEWLRVFQHFNPRLEGLIRPGAIDPDEVDDVLSHTWEQAYIHIRLGRLTSPNVMWTWCSTVALRRLKDFQKSRGRAAKRELRVDAGDDLREWQLSSPEQSIIDRLAQVDEDPFEGTASVDGPTFQARWATLSERDRQFAYLYGVDDFSHAEVATVLELASEAASRQRWLRIKKHMRGL